MSEADDVEVAARHRICTLATCNLNQWAMDFAGNLERVQRSITEVRRAVAACMTNQAPHSARSHEPPRFLSRHDPRGRIGTLARATSYRQATP